MTRWSRIAIAACVALWAVALVVPPTSAAGPPNDDIADATVISSLPYQNQEDTAGATVAPTDPVSCLSPDETYVRTVWFTYQATRTERLKLLTLSTGTVVYGFGVVDVTGGAFDVIGCSVSGQLVFDVDAGRSYGVMLAVPSSEADNGDSLFVLEALVQQRVPFTFDPPAARPGETVTVYANIAHESDVPCDPLDATLLFSRDPTIIEREDPSLFNPLTASPSGSVYDPPIPVVQRWVLPSIPAGTYATYWQCNEPFAGPEVWRAADFTVLPAELPPTDSGRAAGATQPSDPSTRGVAGAAGLAGALGFTAAVLVLFRRARGAMQPRLGRRRPSHPAT